VSPLTSLSLNPFRCNVCPANKQQSEKDNKMLTGIGCYLNTLSAFDMLKKKKTKHNWTQNPPSHPRRQQSPGKSPPLPGHVGWSWLSALASGLPCGRTWCLHHGKLHHLHVHPRKLRWNLKIPPRGKGKTWSKTSTIYKQTTHFLGFYVSFEGMYCPFHAPFFCFGGGCWDRKF